MVLFNLLITKAHKDRKQLKNMVENREKNTVNKRIAKQTRKKPKTDSFIL